MLTLRHLGALGVIGCVLAASACSSGVDSSCGNYFDALVSLESQCSTGVALFDSSERASFLHLCDAIALAPGTSNFASEIDTCANAVKSSTCNGLNLASCTDRGTLADGTACGSPIQCSGGRCDTSKTTPNPASELQCGVCASYAPLGGLCPATPCDPTSASCVNGKCTAFVPSGGACGSTTGQCVAGFECDAKTSTCQPYPTQGQTCSGQCAWPSKCVSATCAAPVQQGGACPTGFECASNLECDTQTHTCQPPAVASMGQACGFVNNQYVQCSSGLVCTKQVCVTAPTVGATCTVGQSECDPFLLCINGTCQVPDYTVCK